MKYTNTVLTVLVVAVLILTFGVFTQEQQNFGSVAPLGGYNYTQYTTAVATTTQVMDAPGILGSVIITEDAAGTVVLYDATSTAAIGTGKEIRIADFQAAAAEGVYTFDANLTNGLVFVTSTGYNFAGDWTFTWRKGY